MEIEHALLLAVPLHVDGAPRESARHEPAVAGSLPGRPLKGDVEDVGGDVFADVPALGRPPDHASDCVPKHVVSAQEIGEASQIAVLWRAHRCALAFPEPLTFIVHSPAKTDLYSHSTAKRVEDSGVQRTSAETRKLWNRASVAVADVSG